MSSRDDAAAALLAMLAEAKSVAIVGMAKNTGKTVTLNGLVRAAADGELKLGLTSIGRDGEKADEILLAPKPRIFAPAGSLVATSRRALLNCEAEIEVVQETNCHTAVGTVLIGVVSTAGLVELAGPTLMSQMKALVARLQGLGAGLVVLDGAFDRASAAAPGVTDATVLATGAALANSMSAAIEMTADRIERLSLPPAERDIMAACRSVMRAGGIGFLNRDGETRLMPASRSLIAGEVLERSVTKGTAAVVMTGAVGDEVLAALVALAKAAAPVRLVIRNGTCLFAARRLRHSFITAGGSIRVVEPIRLAAVTVNPTSLSSRHFPAREFFWASAKAFAPYPVLDLMAGYSTLRLDAGIQEE
jgi:hypothetical protein